MLRLNTLMNKKTTHKIAACFAAILLSTSLVACNKNDAKNRDYFIVTYHYNYNGAPKDVYVKQYIDKEDDLIKPADPNREDYAFVNWCTDKKGDRPYRYFGEYVEKDLDLYASWKDFNSLSDAEKISRYLTRIDELSGNIIACDEKVEGFIGYSVVEGAVFPINESRLYQRYKDITTVDYTAYGKNPSGEVISELVGKEQYFYDDAKFYKIYKDVDGDSQDQSTYDDATLNPDNLDSMLNIDYENRNMSILKELADTLAYPADGVIVDYGVVLDEEANEYDKVIPFNYTKLTKETTTYAFEFNYYRCVEATQLGGYSEETFNLQYAIQLTDGVITKSKVVEEYYNFLGGELLMVQAITRTANYTPGDINREFTGEKYNPTEYQHYPSSSTN